MVSFQYSNSPVPKRLFSYGRNAIPTISNATMNKYRERLKEKYVPRNHNVSGQFHISAVFNDPNVSGYYGTGRWVDPINQ
jgi:hypothetical protein